MTVLHVVSSLNMGGAEQFVVDICDAMNKQQPGMAAILNFGSAADTLMARCRQCDIKVHQVIDGSKFKQFTALRALIKQYKAVHIHSSHCLASILAAAMFCQSRLFYTRHNNVVHQSLKWRLIYQIAAFKLTRIVFIAEIARQGFLQRYPAFKTKSTLIYNGIQPILTQRPASKVIRLGQVGRFVPLKAQHLLLAALNQLSAAQRQGFEVNFFGDGPLLEDCRDLARPLQQDMDIVFHGLEMDKARIYQNIDVLVVTSETEGLSLVMLEALSAGCLVIATEVGGNPEIVQHEKSGLLYMSGNATQLASLLSQLLQDNNWRALITAGEHRFFSLFEQKKCVENYLALYD